MHEDTAQLVLAPAPFLVAPTVHMLGEANAFWGLSLIDELCCVLKDENQPLTGCRPPRRRLEMSG